MFLQPVEQVGDGLVGAQPGERNIYCRPTIVIEHGEMGYAIQFGDLAMVEDRQLIARVCRVQRELEAGGTRGSRRENPVPGVL